MRGGRNFLATRNRRDSVRAMFPRTTLLAISLGIAGLASAAEPDWKPLWDGKTLQGWHPIGKGEWKAEDGQIVGATRRRRRSTPTW